MTHARSDTLGGSKVKRVMSLEMEEITTIDDFKKMMDIFCGQAYLVQTTPTDLLKLLSTSSNIVLTRFTGKIEDYVDLIRKARTSDVKDAVFKFTVSDEATLDEVVDLAMNTEESFPMHIEPKFCIDLKSGVESGRCMVEILDVK